MPTEAPESSAPAASGPAPVLRCIHCEADIDFCSFCDRTDCAVAACYGCLVIALKEARPPLHPHGG